MRLLFLLLVMIPAVSADTSFFENGDFIMGDLPPGGAPPEIGGIGGRPPEPCNSLWICEEWSKCLGTVRTRDCVDISYCGGWEKPPLLMDCYEPLPPDRIIGCVDFVALDGVISGWKQDFFRFDIVDEGVRKWKSSEDCP